MKVTIDLELLNKLDLSPSEYCALILIEENEIIHYPIGDAILTSLKRKNWIDDSNKIIRKDFKEKDIFDQWIELWPTSILPGGYRVSGNYHDCKERMKRFFKKYGYSWDIVMKATKNYLRRQEAKNWEMTKKNIRFIYDQTNGSMLAEECEAVINGREEDKTNGNVMFL